MTAEQFCNLPQKDRDLLLAIYEARETYFYLLEGTLKEWAIIDKDEQKKMNKLLKAIVEYADFLGDIVVRGSDKKEEKQ